MLPLKLPLQLSGSLLPSVADFQERSRHVDIQHFAIQDWKEVFDIVMSFIPGIINPGDDLTKPLGWISHARHARRIKLKFAKNRQFQTVCSEQTNYSTLSTLFRTHLRKLLEL